MKTLTRTKVIALGLASMMVLPLALTACNGNTGNSDEYVITLNYNDDNAHYDRDIYVDKGESVSKVPGVPSREGYSFAGWYTAAEGGEEVNLSGYKPEGDVTLYAHWTAGIYDVTFDWNVADKSKNVVYQVEYNHTVGEGDKPVPAAAQAPANSGFRFGDGWMTSADGSQINVTFPATIKKNTTFYAFWVTADTKVFTIHYDLSATGYNSTTKIKDSVYYSNDENGVALAAATNKAKRTGYELAGWAIKKDSATADYAADGTITPTASTAGIKEVKPGEEYELTLYAVWQKKSYAIVVESYDKGIKSELKKLTKVYEETITEAEMPEVPTRAGFHFVGWYDRKTAGNPITFPYKVEGAATIYARWQADAVETTTFDAEFVVIDPDLNTPGYSGATTTGFGRIVPDGDGSFGATTQHQKDGTITTTYYQSYLYLKDFELVFEIESDADTTVDFILRASNESCVGASRTFNPDGDTGYAVIVNGVPLTGYSFTTQADKFADYNLGKVQLKQGKNTIILRTNNENKSGGGTTGALAPIIDCIKLTGGSAKLTWMPEYDNLYQ